MTAANGGRSGDFASGLMLTLTMLLCAGGCSTPQPARDLASQGAVTADKAQGETQAFIQRATQAYQRREAIVLSLAQGEIRDTSAGDFRAWLASEAGVPTDKDKVELIRNIAEQSRKSRELLEATLAAKVKQIRDAAGGPVNVPAQSLGGAKKAFLNLAQEMTPEEWLRFSWKYASQLQADLKELQAQGASQDAPK